MIEELPSELQSQIEQEAKDRSMGFENKGTGFIVRTEYALGAEKYAFKWQEAKRRAERYEKALRDIRRWELATGKKIRVKHLDILKDIMRVVNNALTPKQTTDDTAK